jgi:hypothetical protein
MRSHTTKTAVYITTFNFIETMSLTSKFKFFVSLLNCHIKFDIKECEIPVPVPRVT